jgi:hypothetical protein
MSCLDLLETVNSVREGNELYREFESGTRLTREDQPRSGRPPTANTPEKEERLQRFISQSRFWSVDDLAGAASQLRNSMSNAS